MSFLGVLCRQLNNELYLGELGGNRKSVLIKWWKIIENMGALIRISTFFTRFPKFLSLILVDLNMHV